MFCFWGVRGVLGGSREGSFWGVRVAAKDGVRDLKNGPSGALPLHPSVRNKSQDGDGCVRGTCGAVAMPQDVVELWVEDPRDVGRVTQPRGTTVGPSTNVVESSGSVHGMEGPRCVILKITSSDVGTGAPSRSVLVSWRSQPSGLVPTTSVGELNLIGEPKNPSVVHPPHSTVLRREEGKGIHIQLTDRNNISFILV